MNKHLSIRIYGTVQGVFFRHSAREKARELNIRGFARNDDDGSVYIEAEGDEAALEQFLAWCRKGPPQAAVEKVDVLPSDELKNFSEFSMV